MNDSTSTVVPVVGLTNDQSTALVTNLIFGSMWMGAFGWEAVSTLSFDWRLIKETRWKSALSTAHTLAYYIARYTTLTFLVVYVATNATPASVTSTGQCQARVNADAVLFVISECSILLVFFLRTMALWNMDLRVIVSLAISLVVTFALGLTIPAHGKGVIVKGFCTWKVAGFWVGAAMVALAVSSLLCLFLTIIKLKGQGWRGLWQQLWQQSSQSIDAEDVSRFIVQRTVCFFVVMLTCIIIALVVYFSVPFVLWQLIVVPAYLAISASLAGRLFRKSWNITHSAAYNRPPSYFPGDWHDNSRNVFAASRSEDTFSFVEGQFNRLNAMSVKSLALREKKSPSGSDVSRRASAPALRNTNVEDDLESGEIRDDGAGGISQAPSFQDTRRGSGRRPSLPGVRAKEANAARSLTTQSAISNDDAAGHVLHRHFSTSSLSFAEASAAARDDLPSPSRSRLWLDSSALRMEASTSASGMSDGGSVNSSAGSSLPGASAKHLAAKNSKRLILDSANEAGATLSKNTQWKRQASAPSTLAGEVITPPRTAFLASSPALISPNSLTDVRSNRDNYDFDVIKQSLAGPKRSRSQTSPDTPAEDDLLSAFRATVEDDARRVSISNLSDDSRPRTSRGTTTRARILERSKSSSAHMQRSVSLFDERPKTRNGEMSLLKSQIMSNLAPIQEQKDHSFRFV